MSCYNLYFKISFLYIQPLTNKDTISFKLQLLKNYTILLLYCLFHIIYTILKMVMSLVLGENEG